jgi:hypothetical protein
MTESGMSAGSAQSSRSPSFALRGVLPNVLRRFAEMTAAAATFFRSSRPGSIDAQAESGAVETETAAATAPLSANAGLDREPQIETIARFVPDQQEIERRRDLVRIFFNDFWDGATDKPAAFVARLDEAEDYLNERLAANGEAWRVDAKTRLMLGLPARASSSGPAKRRPSEL